MNPNRLLRQGLLSKVLPYIENIKDPPNGFYTMFAPKGIKSVSENTQCAIILTLNEDDDDYVPDVAIENGLEAICIIAEAKSVIRNAKDDKPTATPVELVVALNYFLNHDAFINLL